VDVTIFDGSTTKPCTVAEAKAAANQPGISWIDARLQGNDATEAEQLLAAVGLDPAATQQLIDHGLGTDFQLSTTDVHGVCWIDNGDGSPAVQVFFAWNQQRLVTVRNTGDAGIAQVRQLVGQRADVLKKDPSTLLGVVLQLMLATVQRGLTQTMIGVGTLDMEIIDTSTPTPRQTQQLIEFRKSVQPLVLRFPMYVLNVQAALIDPVPVAGLDADGMAQMQQFLTSVQATSGLIDTLAGGIRNTAQDIQAQVGAWQSNRINVLTIVTMIFLPISFLTGYFGMNFNWLDDQLNSFWTWVILGVGLPLLLVAVCISLLATSGYNVPKIFRRKQHSASSYPR